MQEQITVSQGLTWLKILKDRQKELVVLRNANAKETHRWMGNDKDIEKPVYDIKKVDSAVRKLTMEISKLDMAIKESNAKSKLDSYSIDESILGDVE